MVGKIPEKIPDFPGFLNAPGYEAALFENPPLLTFKISNGKGCADTGIREGCGPFPGFGGIGRDNKSFDFLQSLRLENLYDDFLILQGNTRNFCSKDKIAALVQDFRCWERWLSGPRCSVFA